MNSGWFAQVRGVMRLELRKSLLGRRALPIYLLGLIPIGLTLSFVTVSSFLGIPDEFRGQSGAYLFYVALVFIPTLRFLVFFGCVWVFMNLFRGEVIDRSLHYYFLTPIRRELLVAGKYLSAWLSSTLVFGGSMLVCFIIAYGFLAGGASGAIFDASALGTLFQCLAVIALACLGYGAVFLVVGLFLRSLIVPALLIFLLEGANVFLPAALKKISVIFYLQGLMPLPPEDGPINVLVEPVSVWIAVPGFVLFTVLTLVAAAFRIRNMEIAYGTD